MATRMQQRRGTANQWISTNSGNGPILAAGEVGFESDTNKFKIGDGVNHWVDLTYFTDADSIVSAVSGIVDGAPGLLNTLNELAAALGDDPNFLTNYATITYVDEAVGNATVDQSLLAGAGIDWNTGTEQFDIDLTTIQGRVTGVSDTEIGYLNGVTSAIQTQLDAKAPLADPTFTGTATANDLIVNGDFTVNGTNFAASATTIVIEDNMLQLAHTNPSNSVDLGFTVAYNDGAAKHAGLVRDVSDSKWKLFLGVSDEPTTVVDFTQGSLDALAVGALEAASLVLSGDITLGAKLFANSSEGTAGQVLASTGTGVEWITPAGGAAFSEFMLIGA